MLKSIDSTGFTHIHRRIPYYFFCVKEIGNLICNLLERNLLILYSDFKIALTTGFRDIMDDFMVE